MLLDELFDIGRHCGRGIYRRKRRGRPPPLAPEDQLGLILFYFGSTMTMKFLFMIFGITPSACLRTLRHMLIKTL
jgi:hypothetical protein